MRFWIWARRFALWTAPLAISVVAWAELLWPPIAFYRHLHRPSLSLVLLQLIKPENPIYKTWGEGYIFISVTLLIIFILYGYARQVFNYFEPSDSGISVLKTSMHLLIEDGAGQSGIVTRKQLFHANRPGITAYSLNHVADSRDGYVEYESIDLKSFLGDQSITKELLIRKVGRNVEVKELYKAALPHGFFMTYLPKQLVQILYDNTSLFQNAIVQRTGRVRYIGEYSESEGVFSLASVQYPVYNLELQVSFPVNFSPAEGDIRGFIIRDNAVEEIALKPVRDDPQRVIWSASARRLSQAKLQIQWKNRPTQPRR